MFKSAASRMQQETDFLIASSKRHTEAVAGFCRAKKRPSLLGAPQMFTRRGAHCDHNVSQLLKVVCCRTASSRFHCQRLRHRGGICFRVSPCQCAPLGAYPSATALSAAHAVCMPPGSWAPLLRCIVAAASASAASFWVSLRDLERWIPCRLPD